MEAIRQHENEMEVGEKTGCRVKLRNVSAGEEPESDWETRGGKGEASASAEGPQLIVNRAKKGAGRRASGEERMEKWGRNNAEEMKDE